MEWRHSVKLAWLLVRMHHLCASEVGKVMVYDRYGNMRTPEDIGKRFWSYRVEKFRMPQPGDEKSTGAAARGHVLEPVAIDLAKKLKLIPSGFMHLDDVLVGEKASGIDLTLGWSPDGVLANGHLPDCNQAWWPNDVPIVEGVEVKCLAPAGHAKNATCQIKDSDYYYQLATAFAACPSLERMHLILYNPDLKDNMLVPRMVVRTIEKDDMKEAICQVVDTEHMLNTWTDKQLQEEFDFLWSNNVSIDQEKIAKEARGWNP